MPVDRTATMNTPSSVLSRLSAASQSSSASTLISALLSTSRSVISLPPACQGNGGAQAKLSGFSGEFPRAVANLRAFAEDYAAGVRSPAELWPSAHTHFTAQLFAGTAAKTAPAP